MIYENASGTHKTPRWAQKLLSRSRHPSCVLIDIVSKARKDGAPIIVKYKHEFPDVTDLRLNFDIDRGIIVTAAFSVNGHSAGCIQETVPIAADCVLEARITKLEALRRKLGRKSPQDISEYCLYFERAGKRASVFEFYIDPRESDRLIADYYGARDLLQVLDKDPDDDDDDDNDFIEQQQPLGNVKKEKTDKAELRFIKIS
jgi:hypothetical protein